MKVAIFLSVLILGSISQTAIAESDARQEVENCQALDLKIQDFKRQMAQMEQAGSVDPRYQAELDWATGTFDGARCGNILDEQANAESRRLRKAASTSGSHQ